MVVNDILKIEKCYKEEKIIQKKIAFLRSDLTREIFKISYGIRYYYKDNTIKEEYYDFIFKESLQEGTVYYSNEECNSYEEISDITHSSIKRDKRFDEVIRELKIDSF